jgi:hypothetical protein
MSCRALKAYTGEDGAAASSWWNEQNFLCDSARRDDFTACHSFLGDS